MKKLLTGDILKLIAIISMTIDHIGVSIIYPAYTEACFINGTDLLGSIMPDKVKSLYFIYILSRMIGRVAFPIFAFMIAEGACNTRNISKYLLRLTAFAFISEIPYDLLMSDKLFNMSNQNIFWTLSAALLIISIIKEMSDKNIFKSFISVLIIFTASLFLNLSIGGILLIISFYVFKNDRIRLTIGILISTLLLCLSFSALQWFSLLAYPIIYLYNGKRGHTNKYLFYLFYPVHLLLLYII